MAKLYTMKVSDAAWSIVRDQHYDISWTAQHCDDGEVIVKTYSRKLALALFNAEVATIFSYIEGGK